MVLALGLVSFLAWLHQSGRPVDASWRAGSAATANPGGLPNPTSPGGIPNPTSPGTAGARKVSILGAGDVLAHPQVWEQASRDAGGTGFDFFPMFAHVAPAISGADLALCHLETPLAPMAGPYRGFPTFSVPPQVLDGLRRAGFDGCSTASNHSLDQGEAGIARSVAAFKSAGLGHTGTFTSAADAGRLMIYDVHGVKVGHLSYTAHFNGLTPPAGKKWLANRIDPAKITAAARQLRAGGADIVVLSLHWGTEYRHAPDSSQLNWARQLTAVPGIDLILGHHAHVVQPFERIGDTWVVYGMGNELARHAEPIADNREGVMARVTLTEATPGTWRVSTIEAIPTWTDLTPAIRLVDLSRALAEPGLPAADRPVYQGAYNRIRTYVLSRGGQDAGVVVVGGQPAGSGG